MGFGLFLAAAASHARAADACPIVDVTVPLQALARDTAGKADPVQIEAYHRILIDPHPGLYAENVLGLRPGSIMDGRILASLAQARSAPGRGALKAHVRAQLAATLAAFGREFEDFRCNFPIYLADTLGQLDGAGRDVDGRPAMVIGIGSLEQELPQLSLPVFFKHEFFHRYHFQAAGFSDDPGEHQQIWRTLWAEGLATYVSQALTPGATTADALLSGHLEERARPMIPRLSAELLAGMNRIDKGLFDAYFTSGAAAGKQGLPPRAGYYVGYLVAGHLARHRSLGALAHETGETLRQEIARTLRKFARSGGT